MRGWIWAINHSKFPAIENDVFHPCCFKFSTVDYTARQREYLDDVTCQSQHRRIIVYIITSNNTSGHSTLIQWFWFPPEPRQKIIFNVTRLPGDVWKCYPFRSRSHTTPFQHNSSKQFSVWVWIGYEMLGCWYAWAVYMPFKRVKVFLHHC